MLPPPPQFTVVAIAEGGSGRGYDLTDEADGLTFSNVNPGGDEVCTFTIHRSWFAENPEIAKGNLIRIMGGVDILWQGRVEEVDRATGDAEALAVTAYGLGNRMGDVTFREIYIDGDIGRWGEPSNRRRIALIINNELLSQTQTSSGPSTAGQPSLFVQIVSKVSTKVADGEWWYNAGGIEIGEVLYDFVVPSAGGDPSGQHNRVGVCEDDLGGSPVTSIDYSTTPAASQSLPAPTGQKFAFFQSQYTGAATGTFGGDTYGIANPTILGRHSLIPQGIWPDIGFTADQIVGHIVGQAHDITPRQLDSFAYVIPQFTVLTPTTPKDAVATVNEYANADYGVWGPDSPLDATLNGYFDFKQPDPATQHWFAVRSDFADDLSFHTELSALYDTVDVHWTDESGLEHTERFSITSPDLLAANLSPRVYPLEAGKTTAAGAQILAEIFLDIFAGFAPARGSGSLATTIRHYRRGEIPAYYLRADGSNLRIPDILPAETTFALDTTPDRRTTFPIKRVTVDCSGDVTKTNVELDQSTQALSVLLAQEAAQAELVG